MSVSFGRCRYFLAVVFTKVARAVLQNYDHYAAQVLKAVTRLRPAIKHLHGSLHSNPNPTPSPPSPSITLVDVFLPLLKF